MAKAKDIFCPECKRKVAHYDGKAQNYIRSICRNCNLSVVYKPDIDETIAKQREQRWTSSGLRMI